MRVFKLNQIKMNQNGRIVSIDILRGITLLLMLFVNDLFVRGVPSWMVHTKANFDGMGLADLVFPGFLFIVGMSVPFAIQNRLDKGHSKLKVLGHIIIRTLSLLVIGVLMLNSDRLNPEMSGISRSLWSILMYVSVFLTWNNYPRNSRWKKLFLALQLIGIASLIFLVTIFRSGTPEHPGWLETGWWGILGLIGWGYLAGAVAYLFIGAKILPTVLVWLFFAGLNILSQLKLTAFLNPVNPVLGVLLSGDTPSIVLAGLVSCLAFQKLKEKSTLKLTAILLISALAAIVTGFILRNWFIISKIKGTPSWALICNGITLFLFVVVYLISDVWKKVRWAGIFIPAGQNSLTTYLAPDIIYFIVWGLHLPLFFYKQTQNQLLAVAGSLAWAILMVFFAALLSKMKIKLRL